MGANGRKGAMRAALGLLMVMALIGGCSSQSEMVVAPTDSSDDMNMTTATADRDTLSTLGISSEVDGSTASSVSYSLSAGDRLGCTIFANDRMEVTPVFAKKN